MTKMVLLVTLTASLAVLTTTHAAPPAEDLIVPRVRKPAWGDVEADPRWPGRLYLHVRNWPADGNLKLPTPFPNIIRTYARNDPERRPLPLIFNDDATEITVKLPALDDGQAAPVLVVETVERTIQYDDGMIVLSALDAEVTGDKAKLETHPGNYRIGFWTNPLDTVGWRYKPTRWGMYDVELTYSLAKGDGTKVKVHLGASVVEGELKATGSWYQYTTIKLGRVYFETAQPKTIIVRCKEKAGPAVMNLKAVILRPAPEGKPITQAEDKSITLHARDSTVSGVNLRYEPKPIKNTLGYWSNTNDHAYWDFKVTTPGRFKVEVLQGCGKGHGGSTAAVIAGKQQLEFIVEDTGHFQNFKPRLVGEITLAKPGAHRLTVKGLKKAKGAVMDVRQVRLIPVE